MRKRLTILATLLLLPALLPASAAGQEVASPGWAIGAAGGLITYSPEADSREYGGGIEGFVRYTLPSNVQVMGGVGYGSVNVDGTADNRTFVSIFGDVRLLLNHSPSVVPYIGARAAYVHQSIEGAINGIDREISGNGGNFSGLFGILVRLVPRLALQADLLFGIAPFGDLKVDGETISDTSSSGFSGGLKIGLVYSIS